MGKRSTDLILPAGLTIEQIKKVKEEILDEMSGFTQLKIDVSQISRIDLSGIQMLLSLLRTQFSSKKEIEFTGSFQKPVLETFRLGGFIPEGMKDTEEIENELRQFA